ncbi:MAG: dienelactone hydrolase family protein [Alphaproteobacteria bacterium]
MAGEFIDIPAADGGSFKGYLAVPASGGGPGLVMLQEIFGVNEGMRWVADLFAEEGYTVLVPDLFWRQEPGVELVPDEAGLQRAFALLGAFDLDNAVRDIAATVETLRALPQVSGPGGGKVGALGFCLGGKLAFLAAARTDIDVAVGYYGVGIEDHIDEAKYIACPLVLHFAGADNHVPAEAVERIEAALAGQEGVDIHVYPGVGHAFYHPQRSSYDRPAAWMSHSRTIAALRSAMGPHYDLSALWDKHCEYEFGTRDVDATMATMVAQPYVNHIPTMTGGVGYDLLHRFYKHHFIPKTPQDTQLVPISRTIGADRVVDEMLFCFTHDIEIDWMLPGVAPTGRYVEVPLVAIVCFRGDKLYNEHIYWDQASVLVQIGLLDAKLLPVAGVETARKLVDETLPSNTLMARWAESKPVAAE